MRLFKGIYLLLCAGAGQWTPASVQRIASRSPMSRQPAASMTVRMSVPRAAVREENPVSERPVPRCRPASQLGVINVSRIATIK